MDFSRTDEHFCSMDDDDVERLFDLLSRRYELLERLADSGLSKGDLERELDVSRSTIDRAIRALEAKGIVDRSNGTVSVTPWGRVALDGYRQFRDGMLGLTAARPIFESFDGSVTIPFETFRSAEVVLPDRQSPHRPIMAFREFLEDAEEVRSIGTGLLPEYVRTYHAQIVEGNLTAELVVQSSVLDDLLVNYWEPVNDALSTDRLAIYETSLDRLFSLKIGHTDRQEMAIIGYADHGVTGFIRSDADAAVEWAENAFHRVKSDGTLVAPRD